MWSDRGSFFIQRISCAFLHNEQRKFTLTMAVLHQHREKDKDRQTYYFSWRCFVGQQFSFSWHEFSQEQGRQQIPTNSEISSSVTTPSLTLIVPCNVARTSIFSRRIPTEPHIGWWGQYMACILATKSVIPSLAFLSSFTKSKTIWKFAALSLVARDE